MGTQKEGGGHETFRAAVGGSKPKTGNGRKELTPEAWESHTSALPQNFQGLLNA